MKNFFIEDKAVNDFQLFGSLHLSLIALLIIGIIMIVINNDRIKDLSSKTKNGIRIFIAVFIFLTMGVYYISRIAYNAYDWHVHLPLHFCFIAGYMFIFALITKRWSLYKIAYFMAFMGPIPAIIWPELYRTFDNFIFYQYIISHHFFLLANIFIFYAYDIKITIKDFKKTILIVLGIFGIMTVFNMIFNTNYIFSSEIPPHVLKLYPFISYFNYPIIIIFVTGIFLMWLAYLFPLFKNKKDNIALSENT